MFDPTCQEIKLLLFDYRRRETENAPEVSRHLMECGSCRDYFSRMKGLLNPAGINTDISDKEEILPFDKDRLFDRIIKKASIGQESGNNESVPDNDPYINPVPKEFTDTLIGDKEDLRPPQAPRPVFTPVYSDKPEDLTDFEIEDFHTNENISNILTPIFSRRLIRPVAAAMAIAACSFFIIRTADFFVPDTVPGAERADTAPLLFQDFSETDSPEGIRVLESANAVWSFQGDMETVLVLSRGTLLIEYTADALYPFRLIGPDYEIEVIGTVFYADAGNNCEIGVLAGSVKVTRKGSESIITDGMRLDADGSLTEIPPEIFARVKQHINIEKHKSLPPDFQDESGYGKKIASSDLSGSQVSRDIHKSKTSDYGAGADLQKDIIKRDTALHHHRETTKDEVQKADKFVHNLPLGTRSSHSSRAGESITRREEVKAAKPKPRPHADIWSRVENALAAGNWSRAAIEMEALLEVVSPTGSTAALIHLDLARIYSDQLNRPDHASEHLRIFLGNWPDDVAAPYALRSLCRNASMTGRAEPLCEDRRP